MAELPNGLVALQVVGFAISSALVAEVLQWFFIYRKPEYKALKANLEKAAAKVEEAKDAAGGAKGVQKREAKLAKWKEETAKQQAANQFKTGIIMLVVMVGSFRLLGNLFGSAGVVANLPFEPPALLRKIIQRGLTDAGPRDGSALFIYVLCQSSLRPFISKLLGWGPSRAMAEIQPSMPRHLGFDQKRE